MSEYTAFIVGNPLPKLMHMHQDGGKLCLLEGFPLIMLLNLPKMSERECASLQTDDLEVACLLWDRKNVPIPTFVLRTASGLTFEGIFNSHVAPANTVQWFLEWQDDERKDSLLVLGQDNGVLRSIRMLGLPPCIIDEFSLGLRLQLDKLYVLEQFNAAYLAMTRRYSIDELFTIAPFVQKFSLPK
ncbi:MAG: hypothetical protein KKB70_01775 [Proteobacteria bacterium]|nr:hypothetical protein [Pseudomonadota bacterium]